MALQGVCPARHRIDGAEGPLRRVIVEVTAATPSRQLGKKPVGKEGPKSGEMAGTRPEKRPQKEGPRKPLEEGCVQAKRRGLGRSSPPWAGQGPRVEA